MKKGTENIKIASEILGDDFITPEEISAASGIIYSPFQLNLLKGFIPEPEPLHICKSTECAVIALPPSSRSLLGVRMLNRKLFYSGTGGWYSDKGERFSHKEKTGTGWLTIGKTLPIIVDSRGVVRNATAVEVAWLVKIFFEVRGIRLLKEGFVRTSSRDSTGNHVLVGLFGHQGLHIGGYREVFGIGPGILSPSVANTTFARA
ncbi:MAG: hypothetical protein NTU85_00245 [Candidatus Kaiserbacteria bacterium]|nr:hypothetical protein [Candidatus Kaiserbacteria bacterium]